MIDPFDTSDGCPTVSNFPSSVNYEFHTLLGGEPDWLSLSHVLTFVQSAVTRKMKSFRTINAAMVNHQGYPERDSPSSKRLYYSQTQFSLLESGVIIPTYGEGQRS